LEKGQILEKSHFFGAHSSYEWDGQPNFKFNIDVETLLIYRLILRKLNFLGWLATFDTLHLVAFWGLLGAFSAAYNVKVLLSKYQSIDMHCIMLPVKYDGGLSMSVLKNKQLFKKNGRQKFTFSK
jgi:hypothetical protein